MTLLDYFLIASTILLVIAGIVISGNRWWLNLLVKVPYNLAALAGAILVASRQGWIG
jgi:hypothetical protein